MSAEVQAREASVPQPRFFLWFGNVLNTHQQKSKNLFADLQLRIKYCKVLLGSVESYQVISSPGKYVADALILHLGPEPRCALCALCAMDKDAFAKVLDNSLSSLRQQILEVLCASLCIFFAQKTSAQGTKFSFC